MTPLLTDLCVIEVSAFIAAPLGGMTLAQLGAEVIRIDPIGGNIDYRRWPLNAAGESIYWASLNKGKRSVAIDLRHAEGQELARALIAAPGEGRGMLVTNLPAKGWMDYDVLRQSRQDLIMLQLTGNPDGSSAVDYTVNCASGLPFATGATADPVNHVLPVWDIAAGLYIATGLLAAERHRSRTGAGQKVVLSLADVMLATVANLGFTAEVEINGAGRQPIGNDLYGAYGHDFATRDGRRIMVVAITDRQWAALGKATGLSERLAMIGPMMAVDLSTEGGRFAARHAISAVLEPWFAGRTLAEIRETLDAGGVLWGAYQDFVQLVGEDPRFSTANPMFSQVDHPGIGRFLTPGSPLAFGAVPRQEPGPAPRLGSATEAVLHDRLGLCAHEIARLAEKGVVSL
ncbi:MAG: CoA transferase [Aurantimonas endophytica]|uniref:2-methylfumaryl-CoA isomerase n=1 Tax=Aurantimonas endophytica TaxID=1522175 RepID=A0A7W6MPZ5_9HYPH|nr:CoA transferase [Aurantimonas endophytica]MBB4003409.1 2-methylfumaryl-CoA isomerase [Aurantimonas endophytica]MCO6404270.1 2-methylfumaryl-CoA isomerase [Aurantimonas endophytica]